MITTGQIIKLTDKLRLSPFQISILKDQGDQYDLEKLVKRGDVLYAPYLRDSNGIAKLLFRPRADLIGSTRILVKASRGIRLYRTGFYSVRNCMGCKYYADPTGKTIDKKLFYQIV